MFAARLIAVSLSFFVLLYSGLSLTASCLWERVWLHLQSHRHRYPAHRSANFLFGLRVLPLLLSTAVTVAVTVPSFVLFEPRSVDEPIGIAALLLGCCGLMLGALGAWNAGRALKVASRAITVWLREATLVDLRGKVPVVRISPVIPALTAAGILRPRILMSGAAEFLLTEKELQTALRHELAHVRRRDNLKKLLLRLVAFPGMAGLEKAWLEASELAADDAAVFSASEALDLAAALIKLSRLAPVEAQVDLMTALVHSPTVAMNARVERLIAWSEWRRVPSTRENSSWFTVSWFTACTTLVVGATFVLTYRQLLVGVHAATEWLVR